MNTPNSERGEEDLVNAAIVYDFDGTLAEGNIQEPSLIPNHLGLSIEEFWGNVRLQSARQNADPILVYLLHLLQEAHECERPITRQVLAAHAAPTFFQGVETFFHRINAYARERRLLLSHYIVSSGNAEMIEATSIARHFRKIFASRYLYDENGQATWPGVAINYTTKTQYLFRINKGVDNSWDDEVVNRWQPMAERPVPFSRMIYIGDGDTDIPSMKMVRHQGGHSIAVFDPKRWESPSMQEKVYNLISEDRADAVVPADYRTGSHLDVTLKGVLARLARDHAGYRGQRMSECA